MREVVSAACKAAATSVITDFGAPWTNLANALDVNGQGAASSDAGGGDGTDSLELAGWAFMVPASATIVGLKVRVRHSANEGFGVGQSATVILYLDGGLIGDGQTVVGEPHDEGSWAEFGGPTDLWGTALTPAIVNSDTFGISYRAVASFGFIGQVDGAELTVYYTTSSAIAPIITQVIWKGARR